MCLIRTSRQCRNEASSCSALISTNHADIKVSGGQTAADAAREQRHYALADYVEGFQPGPRGELAISCCTQYSHSF